VEFNVSSIPAGATVDSATLTLCATAVPSSTKTYEVHRVTASWVEGSVTWDTQPAVAASATTSATTPASAACMTWTVTSDVQLWVDGTTNNGWRVFDTVEGSGPNKTNVFRSKEDTAVPADVPKLDVTYTAAGAMTRHESTDLTVDGTDQVTMVTVQDTKNSGTVSVTVNLEDPSATRHIARLSTLRPAGQSPTSM